MKNLMKFPATYAERRKIQYRRVLREMQGADEILRAAFGGPEPKEDRRPKYAATVPEGWSVIEGGVQAPTGRQ